MFREQQPCRIEISNTKFVDFLNTNLSFGVNYTSLIKIIGFKIKYSD